MGIDFLTCTKCEKTYPDCGPCVWCEECSSPFCSAKCAAIQNEGEKEESCVDCREENPSTVNLLTFMLARAGITQEEAEQLYLSERTSSAQKEGT